MTSTRKRCGGREGDGVVGGGRDLEIRHMSADSVAFKQ